MDIRMDDDTRGIWSSQEAPSQQGSMLMKKYMVPTGAMAILRISIWEMHL
jgi:hypothetical protein